jgi:hypothetical protein
MLVEHRGRWKENASNARKLGPGDEKIPSLLLKLSNRLEWCTAVK